jgi:hypothetical protein
MPIRIIIEFNNCNNHMDAVRKNMILVRMQISKSDIRILWMRLRLQILQITAPIPAFACKPLYQTMIAA